MRPPRPSSLPRRRGSRSARLVLTFLSITPATLMSEALPALRLHLREPLAARRCSCRVSAPLVISPAKRPLSSTTSLLTLLPDIVLCAWTRLAVESIASTGALSASETLTCVERVQGEQHLQQRSPLDNPGYLAALRVGEALHPELVEVVGEVLDRAGVGDLGRPDRQLSHLLRSRDLAATWRR